MPTRNINLIPEMDTMVAERITSGHYANASEVVRAGLRALAREEEEIVKLQDLREALMEGEKGPWLNGEAVFERVRKRLKERAGARERTHVA